ncbi:hypothetical protein Lesp02_42180 [Lentzea sp. NBRC 105346]|uniref:hypothetical protein n=1 Tax=Lentzea sp. NBRC 105346 TaxID=3032205 RepID=UPI0024A11343|nr:hypothetical protein [Lentzea sp. NBRC 105346]GLZ32030.1 hypothetical protein Lesp02_42180 [Lentzea sp. NBRC 105346]
MTEDQLVISTNSVESLIKAVRRHGLAWEETGALLLTTPEKWDVVAVALAGDDGIQRGKGLFVITLPAFDALFTYAEEQDLQVRAMVHSHPYEAFLSPVDRQHGLRVRGFISAVIPTYGDPPVDPSDWGWWRFEDDWHPTQPAIMVEHGPVAKVFTFDSGGLHDD